MIQVKRLTKRFGDKKAVSDLSFEVEPGVVTGFLGPNGAGKSTTMRMILGLERPDSGCALVNGCAYHQLRHPMRTVGALLDADWVHPKRSARNHLRWLAACGGVPSSRVDEVLSQVGLTEVSTKAVGKFSLGMRQRLGLATAMLGNPETYILDEPINGLDTEGIHWIRTVMKDLAAAGKCVFVSSHVLSEMALTAERLIVIAKGDLVADTTVKEFIERGTYTYVRVRAKDPRSLTDAVIRRGATASTAQEDSETVVRITGMTAAQVAETAMGAGVSVYEISENGPRSRRHS